MRPPRPVVFGYDQGELRIYRPENLLRHIGLIYRGTDNRMHLGIPPDKPDKYSDLTLGELNHIIGMMQMLNSASV